MRTEIKEYSQTESALATLREQYGDATYDVATTEGMDFAKAARKEVRGYRTGLEDKRKQIKAPALAQCKLIDSEAKRITLELRKIEAPIDDQIKAHEAILEQRKQDKIDAERKRVEDIQERIEAIRTIVTSVTYMGNPTSKAVQLKINDIVAISIGASFAEFSEQAAQAKNEVRGKLLEIHGAAVQREEEDARLATERKELAAQKAEQDVRDLEQQKRQADDRAEIDRKAKELADQQAEFDRKQSEKEEEERKAEEAQQAEIEDRRKKKEEAESIAKRSEYPGDAAIIDALSSHFDVSDEVAASWLTQLRNAA